MISNKHEEKVFEIANSDAVAKSRVAASWRRSVKVHGLDPAARRRSSRLEDRALYHHKKKNEHFIKIAAPQLDTLYKLVGLSGCGVLMTDSNGIIIEQRLSDVDAPVFGDWGLCEGTDWAEAAEGTNGIGTCLAENRKVMIHTDQHFHTRNTGLSCMGAPIFGPDGKILGALDVSSARNDATDQINKMVFALVGQTAIQIESEYFHACNVGRRIITASRENCGSTALLAVDDHDLVVAASRSARRLFDLGFESDITPVPARDLLGVTHPGKPFCEAETTAVMQALARTGWNISEAARASGIGRSAFYRRMKRLGISKKLH